MPNHQKPIEDCDLWDVLDWNVVAELSADSSSSVYDNPLAGVAKKLIDLGAKPGKEDLEFFHRLVKGWITSGSDAARREQAGSLALLFGADPVQLIDFVALKWGLFKRVTRPRP